MECIVSIINFSFIHTKKKKKRKIVCNEFATNSILTTFRFLYFFLYFIHKFRCLIFLMLRLIVPLKMKDIIVTSWATVSHGLVRDYLHYILFHNNDNKRTLPPSLFISFQFNFLNVPCFIILLKWKSTNYYYVMRV